MIYIHSTVEIYIDIEVTKAKIKLIRDKIADRIIFRSRVKWHEEGEENNVLWFCVFSVLWSFLGSLVFNLFGPPDSVYGTSLFETGC